MYYYIIAEKAISGNGEKYIEFQIDNVEGLKNHYVTPYLKGEDIQINGYNINKQSTSRFQIKQSEYTVKEIISFLDRKYPTVAIVC